jgi:hypothetical protein
MFEASERRQNVSAGTTVAVIGTTSTELLQRRQRQRLCLEPHIWHISNGSQLGCRRSASLFPQLAVMSYTHIQTIASRAVSDGAAAAALVILTGQYLH